MSDNLKINPNQPSNHNNKNDQDKKLLPELNPINNENHEQSRKDEKVEKKQSKVTKTRKRSLSQQSNQNSNSRQASRSRQKKQKQLANEELIQQQDLPDDDEIMKAMGFSSFRTSKNENHTESACEGMRKNSQVKRQYRQYMNRRGNFNRNLDKI